MEISISLSETHSICKNVLTWTTNKSAHKPLIIAPRALSRGKTDERVPMDPFETNQKKRKWKNRPRDQPASPYKLFPAQTSCILRESDNGTTKHDEKADSETSVTSAMPLTTTARNRCIVDPSPSWPATRQTSNVFAQQCTADTVAVQAPVLIVM